MRDLKYLAALYWTEDEVWYGVVPEPETVEYTEKDWEVEQRIQLWRRALQESMDRRN